MNKLKTTSREKLLPFILGGLIILLSVVFTIINPAFITFSSIHSILLTAVPVAIVAIGECTAITAGYFDMSVGLIASLAGVFAAKVVNATGEAVPAVIVGLCIGLLAGVVNGCLVSFLHMNAFITTYAMQLVYRGIVYIITEGMPVKMVAETCKKYLVIGQAKAFGVIQIPIIVMLCLYVLVWLFLRYRKLGRSIYLVGSNAACAHISGINVRMVQFFVFLLTGTLASIAGMLYGSRVGTAPAFMGETLCLEGIASSIVGGTSMSGGKSNLALTFLGVLVVYIVKQGLVMVGLDDAYQYVATGLILFLGVLFQIERKKN